MLSPANMFLLGVIEAKPVNPYEIIARFHYNKYNKILSVSDSSIYAAIRTMCSRGYISYVEKKEGCMPMKKVYSITSKGRAELLLSLRAYLSGNNPDSNGFSISLLFLHYFSKEEALELLHVHQKTWVDLVSDIEDDYNYVINRHSKYPCIPNVASSLQVYTKASAELETVEYVIKLLSHAKVWPQNTFSSSDVYNDGYDEWKDRKNKKKASTDK